MKRLCCGVAAFACGVLTQDAARAAGVTLDCRAGESVRPAVLQQAPSGSRRLDKRTLQVSWKGGKRLFKDEPPFDEPLDGVKWFYCAYDRATQLHLIERDDNGLFTGVLMSEATGELLEAGHTVRVAPDRKRYFAARQPDGLDGEEWLLSGMDGKVRWQGLSVVLDEKETVIAELSDPTWTADGQLEATSTCVNSEGGGDPKKVAVKLEARKGAYAWSPRVRCPGTPPP